MKPPANALKHVKSMAFPSPRQQENGAPAASSSSADAVVSRLEPLALAWALWLKLRTIVTQVAVEPVMLLDGLGFSIMIVYVENLQMDKICRVNLNYTEEVCENLSHYPEENLKLQQSFSMFGMYNGIIMAFIPLFFILFMGAWSDKYGRKVPLVIAIIGHFCWAAGYLVNSWMPEWPVEYILVAALMDSLGGGNVSFLTAANAYISDVTSEETRTSRVGFANSIWFLGGPIGTLLGTYIYKYGGYQILFGTSVLMYIVSLVYLFFLPESHGPFRKIKTTEKTEANDGDQQQQQTAASKDSPGPESEEPERDVEEITAWKMVCDFFSYDRIVDSFRCTFKARGGMLRAFILLLILCNLLRRLGRGAYMYLFTRKVLHWRATDYGLWVTYKNLMAALGSMVAVPLLSSGLGMSDNYLAILGATASVCDYILYGLVSEDVAVLVWVAPAAAILVNSCVIAIRSMLSKFVTGDELGKVSAVMGALDGVMPMVSFSLYTAVYHATVHVFPGAQFFFGASANLLMTIIFIFIIIFTTSKSYSIKDLHETESKGTVQPTSLRFFSERLNRHLQPGREVSDPSTQRTAMVLSAVNFHIATPRQEKRRVGRSQGHRDAPKEVVPSHAPKKLTDADMKLVQEELTFPQRRSSTQSLPQPARRALKGVDNPSYIETESSEPLDRRAEDRVTPRAENPTTSASQKGTTTTTQ
ncbi:proton-coupled folate transporter-like isoform X1 [Penaeus chinensis]|uniref:proton-coupled folate transporter-like isoform X1 n=2 Tax=Penaeus chinensis TaxID=139456 RepID=UPI001FB7A376|nr:proton-coupled folate transporter-like isoform X1 [Penaeus chinensis]